MAAENLKRQSAKYKTDRNYTTKAAERAENIKKNRYKDILPFDHSRVELSLITSDEETDFINASFIRGVYYPRAYIATQGPLPNTVVDFWRMIWEYNIGVIAMACMEFEYGKKKCERYWVEEGCEVLQCGPFSIICGNEEKKKDYVIRTLIATFGSEERIIHQFHYKNWPDHDVPYSIQHILDMIRDIRLLQTDDYPPICVHCSAGCGRTGVICAIDYIWRLLKDEIIPVNFSVYSIIQEMRTQRSSLVQTKEQFELVYSAVIHLFKKELEQINAITDSKEEKIFGYPTALQDSDFNRLPDSNTGNNMIGEKSQDSIGSLSATACTSGATYNDIMVPLTTPKMYKTCKTSNINNLSTHTLDLVSPCTNTPYPLSRTHFGRITQNITSNNSENILPVTDKRCYNVHAPLMRTKSTPFELLQQRQLIMSEHAVKEPAAYPYKPSFLESNVGQCSGLTGSLGNISTVHSSHVYIRLTEDPYFSPTSSSDPGSPIFADFCLEAPSPDISIPKVKEMPSFNLPLSASYHLSHVNESFIQEPLKGQDVFHDTILNFKVTSPSAESPPPLPERTPDSFIVPDEHVQPPQDPLKLQSILQPKVPSVRIGTSMEWGGVSKSKSDDFRLTGRSKSVKVRGSRSEKTRDRSPSPPPLPERTEDSYVIAEEASGVKNVVFEMPLTLQPNDVGTSGSLSSEEPDKQMTRKKSLKILRNVKKNVCNLVKQESETSQSSGSLSFLNFGFGNRFCKPKGPRNPPTTWNI
ncbi:tyrosine-protein phosphatase non-receptor type 22 isoform X2 [Pseudophryne corroboree]|uniref:tyrosine-protein phosphatase non-receptor type 22 isoform X2 n=1 Tax=Pseudophryne corroboree TaxID=495146 RepID=UPI003081288D